PVQVLDTAGIRDTEDQVEKIGVERSQNAAQAADLVLFTIDATTGWIKEDKLIYEQVKHRPLILVINKIDLLEDTQNQSLQFEILDIQSKIFTAAAKNKGIEELETAILEQIEIGNIEASDMDLAINQRQEAALIKAKKSLEQVKLTIEQELPFDFWTIDLRGAINALGEITGEEVTESVLDRIFSKFCIGK
ncbi:MAG: GTPase, partial [Cyanobacteria bacterium P01_A01_bin.68]